MVYYLSSYFPVCVYNVDEAHVVSQRVGNMALILKQLIKIKHFISFHGLIHLFKSIFNNVMLKKDFRIITLLKY